VPTIAKLEIIPLIYRLPAERAYGMARGLTSIRQASLVKLATDDGLEGIGEAWGPPSVTKAYLDLIASYFIGREVYGFEHATSAILSTYYHFGIQNQMTSCLSGIDIACLDAIGKMHGLPVVRLLGDPARSGFVFLVPGRRSLKPAQPPGFNNRLSANWKLLLQIAQHAGGGWPEQARRSAIYLSLSRARA
jgi:L-alanine-DL-glutamate epimerase-like enolase superfamily enzyme